MKLKIDTQTLVDEFFDCTKLMGIIAPVKDYNFIWNINQYMGYNFRVNHSLEIQLRKKERNYFFSVYEYRVPSCSTVHYFYNNQFDGEYLLPEFKHLDFLWLVKEDDDMENDVSFIMQSVKKIPGVQLIVEMTDEKIKNKQHLIL